MIEIEWTIAATAIPGRIVGDDPADPVASARRRLFLGRHRAP